MCALATAIEERRRDIADRDEAYRALEDYRRDLQRRITIDEERQAMLATRREELSSEIEALQREREPASQLLGQLEERARVLAQELAFARSPTEAMQELERLDARLRELRAALAETERKAAQASGQETRLALYRRAQKLLLEEAVAIVPLYVTSQSMLIKPHVKGFWQNRMGILRLKDISIQAN